jgi:ribonuclease-3 family protein
MINIGDYVNLGEMDVKMLNPLVWAYIGDAVYEVYVRSHIISEGIKNAKDLHRASIKYVKASEQSKILEGINSSLSEEEQNIVRRGRNTKTHHIPKNAEVIDYRMATAFECLIGYLFLMKRYDRLDEIMKNIFKGAAN